jgi:predicted glycosyltransferase
VSDSLSYLAAADLVVGMAGYNTTAEILSLRTRALLVPRSGPSAEQQMRARSFAERGWVHWLSPGSLSTESLPEAMAAALDTSPAPVPVEPDLRGQGSVGADGAAPQLVPAVLGEDGRDTAEQLLGQG